MTMDATQPIEELARLVSAMDSNDWVKVQEALRLLSMARFDRGRIYSQPGDLECPSVSCVPEDILLMILSHPKITPQIVAILGGWGGASMVAMIQDRLGVWSDSHFRVAAIRALGTIGGFESSRLLISLARDSVDCVREAAIGELRELAKIHDPNALEDPIPFSTSAHFMWTNHRSDLEKTQAGVLISELERIPGDEAREVLGEVISALEISMQRTLNSRKEE